MKQIFIVLGLLCAPLWARAQSCEDIKDADKANYCRAINANDKKFCQKIQNNDTQSLCLAKVEHKVSYCGRIATDKIKKRCLSYF
jgi:hypothetical protein